jgi:RNA polymerase sigma factor (sigma-70 family)
MTSMVATVDGNWTQAQVTQAGDEPALVGRARDGDSRAFEQLYRRHSDRVFGLCVRLCQGDRAKAEQATQDAFVRAWEKLDSFRGEAQFGTWLHRITVNVVLGEHRLLQRWTTFEDAEANGTPQELAMPAEDPTLSRDLERALARLPKGARTVLWLHDVEGYKHEEIAELTGVAVGTSKAQLHRARKLMKEHLQ